MKRLYTGIIGIVLTGIAAVTLAAVLNVSWQNATTNMDGSTIPATGTGSIQSTRVEWGSCVSGAFGTLAGSVTVNGTVITTPTPNLAPGTYCFRAVHVNTYGIESDPSTVVQKSVQAPKPNPPSNLTVN